MWRACALPIAAVAWYADPQWWTATVAAVALWIAMRRDSQELQQRIEHRLTVLETKIDQYIYINRHE